MENAPPIVAPVVVTPEVHLSAGEPAKSVSLAWAIALTLLLAGMGLAVQFFTVHSIEATVSDNSKERKEDLAAFQKEILEQLPRRQDPSFHASSSWDSELASHTLASDFAPSTLEEALRGSDLYVGTLLRQWDKLPPKKE